jgi:hypothetical protein
MFTLTTSSSSGSKLQWAVIWFCILWMAMYPIYANYYEGLAIEQFQRHLNFMAGNSMFFNPWQYRVLCPYLIEGIYQVLDVTLYSLIDFSSLNVNPPTNSGQKNEVTTKLIELSRNPDFIKYTLVFVGFRFVQHLLIFWLAFKYLTMFISNRALAGLGVVIISLVMGNTVSDSDLSFNTYADVIIYLVAGLIILRKYNAWWLVPLMLVGAFNRETSVLIIPLFFFSRLDLSGRPDWMKVLKSNSRLILVCAVATVLFVAIFIGVRMYYGYQPATVWRVPAGPRMLKLNLLSSVSIKTYMEMFGVFMVLPVWCLLVFRQMHPSLRLFFLVLIPAWFAVHFWSVVCYQSRLFLVPTTLIFLPAVLEYIEKRGSSVPAYGAVRTSPSS